MQALKILSYPLPFKTGLSLAKFSLHLASGVPIALALHSLTSINSSAHHMIVSWWLQTLAERLNINFEVIDNRPINNRPDTALWLSNHISWTDIIVLNANFSLSFLAKHEVSTWPIINIISRAGGTLYVKRGGKQGHSKMLQICNHLQQGKNICVFPEGTTSNGNQVLPWFSRLLQSAVEANMPIQPVAIRYLRPDGSQNTIVPFIDDDEITRHLLRLISSDEVITAQIILLDPINATQWFDALQPKLSLDQLAKHIQKQVANSLSIPAL